MLESLNRSYGSHGSHKKTQEADAHSSYDETLLLPGLPNQLAHLCLARVDPSILYTVCHSWRRLIYSPSFPPFFSLYALLSHQNKNNYLSSIVFSSFDPISNSWTPLPPPPSPLQLLHHHPSFLSRKFPIQSTTVSGHLVLIAAAATTTTATHHFLPALSHPLVFKPLSNQWLLGPPLSEPRRWCATGSVGGSVYVASGLGLNYREDVARSMEEWDMKRKGLEWRWDKKAGLKNVGFSREAVEAVGYRGKLCMVSVNEGAVYDVERDRWEDMPRGMLGGWNGPAATMDESVMYVVDERKGALKRYDIERDCWEKVLESKLLREAEQICAGKGRVCVVCANGKRIVVVDVVAALPRVWVVEPPPMFEVVAVHVLQRMSRTTDWS